MPQLIEKFREFYLEFSLDSLLLLEQIYEPRIVFEDPVHRIHGIQMLRHYFERSLQGLDSCRFDITRQIETPHVVSLEWIMYYQHRRLGRGKPLQLRGSSILEGSEKVTFQRDYYDMGQMVYEHLPLLGWFVRGLKCRIAS